MWWLAGYILIGAIVAGVFLEVASREGVNDTGGWVMLNLVLGWPLAIALVVGMSIGDLAYQIFDRLRR